MKKYISKETLESQCFRRVGKISLVNNTVDLNVSDLSTEKGVYLWLKVKNNNRFEVHYVGKAGSGPKSRMSQHKQGINDATNISRKERIQQSIGVKVNDCLEIWFRKSPEICTEISDKRVSLFSVEEESLSEKYNPPLNRTKRSLNRDLNGIENELLESGGDQFLLWSIAKASNDMDKTNKILSLLRKKFTPELWDAFEFKFIGKYSKGDGKIPQCFRDKTLLVFGKIADVNFKHKAVLIALDDQKQVGINNQYLEFSDRCSENDHSDEFFSIISLAKLKKLNLVNL